jgi:hypothetical protein
MHRARLAFLLGAWLCSVGPAWGDPGTTEGPGDLEQPGDARPLDPGFDPFEGMDPNGRIPAIVKPADLPNPEHWRYIPEGRIKPGNIFQRILVSSFIAPFIFYDEDVGTGFGAAVIDIDFREQRRKEFAGAFLSYTTEGQQNYTFVWRRWLHHLEVPSGGVLQEERSYLRAAGGYSRTLTRRFFGIGPSTNEDEESSYRDEYFFLEIGGEHALPDPGDDLVVSFGARGESHSLGPGHVSGEPSTKNEFPGLFDAADDSRMGSLIAGIRWDTRDSQANPYKGWSVGVDVDAPLIQDGWDVGAVFGAGATKIFGLPPLFHDGCDAQDEHPPTDVLAIGFRGQQAAGDQPFFTLPTLGGSEVLRGYIGGRWRDRASWTSSIEYRFWVLPRGLPIPFTKAIRIERIGAALFYDVGAVGNDVPELVHSRVRHSYGVGLRMSLERSAPFRVDVGFSEDGVNVSARFGLSF